MIKVAEMLSPQPSALWTMVKQCGIDHVVGAMDFSRGTEHLGSEDLPWGYNSLANVQKKYQDFGFELAVIESRPPLNKVKLGLPGRDEEIDSVCQLIRNMGKLEIPVWCYEWMPVFNWLRTSMDIPSRGGALVTGYDHQKMPRQADTEHGTVTEEQLWENLEYFLKCVVPVAEESHVKLAMHPDDPPISPIRGLGRIMRSIENFQRLVDLVPSPTNGITMCQGNFTLMTDDLPNIIRHFGEQKKIFFVHFRDVEGTPENFQETFHDNGKTDMALCMQAYRDIDFEGVLRPDHVPTMEGDNNDNPGYSSIGRLFAVGYIKGLREVVYKN